MVDRPGCNSLYPANTVTIAYAYFTADYPPFENNDIPTEFSPWVGIGTGTDKTKKTDEMVQAGIEGDSNTGFYNQEFWPWIEVYPYDNVQYRSMPTAMIQFGDSIFVEVWYVGQTAYFYIADLSKSGDAQTWPLNFTGSTGTSAEWVIEKNTPPLSHFASPYVFSSAWAEKSGTWYCAGVLPHDAVDMYQNYPSLPASASTKLAYGTAFTDPGEYCDWPVTRTANY